MRTEAINEINRRFDLLCEHATPETIEYGTTGSLINFNMALNLIGGSYAGTWDWTDEMYNQPVLTTDEFNDDTYDELIENLHNRLLLKMGFFDEN